MNKAVFLDRDNTIIYDAPYMADPEQVKIMPGVLDALCEFRKRGFKLIIVTNQSGIGRGMFSEHEMLQVHEKMKELFAENNIFFEDILYCPHAPADNCVCRKPLPGMLQQAGKKHNIDFLNSIMIGDKAADVAAGIAAGCGKSVWLSHGREQIEIDNRECLIAEDLLQAAELLFK